MNKKGSAFAIVICIVIFVVIIIGVILLVIVLNQEKNKNSEKIQISNITLFLKANDKNEQVSIDANYRIISGGNVLSGNLVKDAYNFVGNVSDNILILCSAEKYYSEFINKTFQDSEKQYNISKIDCNLNPIGTIEIYNTGSLQVDGTSDIDMTIKSQGLYKEIQMCMAWTSGILSVNNYVSLGEILVPERLKNKVDKCLELNKTLENNQTSIKFAVKTEKLSKLDTLKFYIFDKDYDENFIINSEYNGKNLGSYNDVEYVISNPNI